MGISQALTRLKQQWHEFFETCSKPSHCIFCGETRLWWNGKRIRSASVLVLGMVAHIVNIAVRRVKCARCGKSWTLRPHGLMPQRHFQLCVVAQGTSMYLFEPETNLTKVGQQLSCHRKTVRRWIQWTAGIAVPQDLYRHIMNASGEPVVVKLREVFLKATSVLTSTVLRTASHVLCLLEVLAAAIGFDPPGLRSVVEAVVANRYRVTTDASPSIPDFARRYLRVPGG